MSIMNTQKKHALLPNSSTDEKARQDFTGQLGKHIHNNISPGNKLIYDQKVLPKIKLEKGREPKSRHEIRKYMNDEPFYQMASACQQKTQEMMWNSVDESIHRQRENLIHKARDISAGKTIGSLNLDKDFIMPGYIAENDHHHMPGGYSTNLLEGDITAGALYDKGAYIYTQGLFGPLMDGIGKAATIKIKSSYPSLKPKRILHIGCTAGASTCAIANAFPEAEVHGIDVGPALLRYAHARAESLNTKIHFHQMNAENLSFEDKSFDLVTCLASLHEMSLTAVQNVFNEAFRVLKTNGLFLVSEIPPYEGLDPWTQFVKDWDTLNNNEPFWGKMHEMDLCYVAKSAGFNPSHYNEGFGPGVAEANAMSKAVEVKNDKFMGSTRGGGNAWYAEMIK